MAMGMAGLALTLAGVGAGVNAIGTVKAGNAAQRAGEAQQRAANSEGDLADYNAAVAELQAKDALDRGVEDEQRFRTKVRGAIGAQRAGFAASNIDVGYGSAVDVQADAAFLGELDALTIRSNAAREAWGFKVQAEDNRRRGKIARQEGEAFAAAGRANKTASRFNVVSSLIGTGSSLLEAKYGMGG
jgi:hypothetical protein